LVHRFGLGDRRGSSRLAGVGRRQDGKKQVNKQEEREKKMELKNSITPAVLTAATSLLQPYAPDLSPTALVRAIKAYKSETTTEANNSISKPMTRVEVAELLGCSLQSVNRYMNEGKIQRIKLSPRSVRIDRQSVLDFLAGTESREG